MYPRFADNGTCLACYRTLVHLVLNPLCHENFAIGSDACAAREGKRVNKGRDIRQFLCLRLYVIFIRGNR